MLYPYATAVPRSICHLVCLRNMGVPLSTHIRGEAARMSPISAIAASPSAVLISLKARGETYHVVTAFTLAKINELTHPDVVRDCAWLNSAAAYFLNTKRKSKQAIYNQRQTHTHRERERKTDRKTNREAESRRLHLNTKICRCRPCLREFALACVKVHSRKGLCPQRLQLACKSNHHAHS